MPSTSNKKAKKRQLIVSQPGTTRRWLLQKKKCNWHLSFHLNQRQQRIPLLSAPLKSNLINLIKFPLITTSAGIRVHTHTHTHNTKDS